MRVYSTETLGPGQSKKLYGTNNCDKENWSFCKAKGTCGPVKTPVFLHQCCRSRNTFMTGPDQTLTPILALLYIQQSLKFSITKLWMITTPPGV